MSDWRSEYLASIREQEKNNPVNLEIVQLCSQLSDRVAALEAEKEVLRSKITPDDRKLSEKPNTTAAAVPIDPSSDPNVAQLQLQLAEALRSNGTLKDRAKAAEDELQALRSKTKEDARKMRSLAAESTALTTKLRDREHELREKRKLVENVQDEMITMNLQMSMAEQERDKVKKENKELVDRWMKRMAQEAEAMNLANER
ncbi:autophagy protein 16 [Colletotrichum higginsianum]|uniref:Autophagy protein 16 n=2 Tax=Colletotrichum higginsianum TaxID=80884 RepID=H1VR74_COLHI|nr:Autophagy protein 16 [Colletotrichum higginsianum IMI 349063]OBR13381.1 Autophagy protein 16 [Colletotrichum higginsianum IMI 349063]TID01645.1 Autophagy protein 16 [Colletotrichum higginsianum]GJC95947.1 autophagy protein 16 [Colletotrichum higginsianum]CCF42730.1 autophagy protein 16 [Colletotrichum higginsianum]